MESRRLPISIPPIHAPKTEKELLPWAERVTKLFVQNFQRFMGALIVTMENVPDGRLLQRSGLTVVDGGPPPGGTLIGSYAPGSFTVSTGKYAIMVKTLQLTGTQQLVLQGNARLVILTNP